MLNLCSKTLNVSKKTGHTEGRGPKFKSKVFSCKKKVSVAPLNKIIGGLLPIPLLPPQISKHL